LPVPFARYAETQLLLQKLKIDFESKDARDIYLQKILKMFKENLSPNIIDENTGFNSLLHECKVSIISI